MTVSELTSEEEIRNAFDVLRDFRGHLTETAYLELVEDMSKQGYRMFGLRDSGRLVSVAGVRIISNFRWVCQVRSLPESRVCDLKPLRIRDLGR